MELKATKSPFLIRYVFSTHIRTKVKTNSVSLHFGINHIFGEKRGVPLEDFLHIVINGGHTQLQRSTR